MSRSNIFHVNLPARSEIFARETGNEDRSSENIPVEITGMDHEGKRFNERTLAREVTDIGCRFEARAQLRCGDVVAVKLLAPSEKMMPFEEPSLFKVAWAAHHRTGCTVGVRKLMGEQLANNKFRF